MNEFYEIAKFMNTWSQQQQQQQEEELHESFVNRLYKCKPVKRTLMTIYFSVLESPSVDFHGAKKSMFNVKVGEF